MCAITHNSIVFQIGILLLLEPMATWKKIEISTENGERVLAQEPLIISASRSTDIPAFYADWFLHRMKEMGYSAWTNPFNGVKGYVSYSNTHFIVFWSKNPRPLMTSGILDYLDSKGINCYIQYSLNDYEAEGLEKGVQPLQYRIETFKMLVERLGKGHVVWRFDPLILTNEVTVDVLLKKIENIGEHLHEYTEKLVFSFADILEYNKVKRNLDRNGVQYKIWTPELMNTFAQKLDSLNQNKGWKLQLATCAEGLNLDNYHISHNRCIDADLIAKIAWKDKELMSFMGIDIKKTVPSLFEPAVIPSDAIALDDTHYFYSAHKKDAGQRKACGCMAAKDIGEYNTCIHLCEYCYANTSKESAQRNYNNHLNNCLSETITGR
jgi:hypothetical protein